MEHALLVGGTDLRKASKLAKSPCDVIVGTPGRVLDFLEKGLINPRFVRLLVRVYGGRVWLGVPCVEGRGSGESQNSRQRVSGAIDDCPDVSV